MKTAIHNFLLVFCSVLLVNPVAAASKTEIDANVAEAIAQFHASSTAGQNLAQQAAGMLVFPRVIKAGFGIGGEYGEGALLIGGNTVAYYNTASASIGFQVGAQIKSQIILLMEQAALDEFRSSDGWEAGVDANVAIVEFGAAKELSSNSIRDPIIGFIFSNKGLMYNLTFEGSKMAEIER